jgi:HEAT repeat protein
MNVAPYVLMLALSTAPGQPPTRAVPPIPPMPPGTPAAPAVGGDEGVLRAAKLETSDEALLNFFRKRTPPAPDGKTLADLANKLASKTLTEADAAHAELVSIGLPAVPALRLIANKVDEPAASGRAKQALTSIEGPNRSTITVSAARLVAARKPTGAATVLLGFLPFADDDHALQNVESALVAVGLRDGKPDPALAAALKDASPLRRAAAAEVLCQVGGLPAHPRVRPLLSDPSPSVRLKVALSLASASDPEAVPVLIDLLADLPAEGRKQVEERLTQIAGEWAVRGPEGNDRVSRQLRREVWAMWWKQTDGEKLLQEFTSRTLPDSEYEKVTALIAKLDDANPTASAAANKELIALSARAVPLLRRAAASTPMPSASSRALESIEKGVPNPLPTAAVRMIALRRPAGTVPALLAYVPFAENEGATSDVVGVLALLGVQEGKADEALVTALTDKVALRRAGAATALCKGGATEALPAVRKLLRDESPEVRFRAGQALAALGEREAVPVLIELIAVLPLNQAHDVEDLLSRAAGEATPSIAVNADPESRKKSVEAWTKWWTENGKKADLARLNASDADLGLTLVIENWNPAKGRGRVIELDSAGKVRWEMGDLFWPYDAQVLRNGNVLVVEQQNRVTERERTGGKVVWDKHFVNVFQCERLRDGRTFLACRHQLMIVDKAGTAVFTHPVNGGQILAARHFRDGSMAYLTYAGQVVRIDAKGKEISSRNLNFVGMGLAGAEILPDERVIVSVNNFNKVIEYSSTGKQNWEAPVTNPLIPYRLPNGHTLVPSNANTALTEIDASGKIVNEQRGLAYKPFRVSRR